MKKNRNRSKKKASKAGRTEFQVFKTKKNRERDREKAKKLKIHES